VSLGLDSSDYHKGLTDSAQATNGFSKSLLSVGTVAAGVGIAAGAAIVGVGVAGVKAFGNFQQGMSEVFTLLPGMSADAMGSMSTDVKDFAKEFGVLPEKEIPALYQALSSGVPAGNVFDFLAISQKAAKGGVTDLTVAVDGISSAVNAYGSDLLSATQASDLMFTTVKLGKTNFEQLASSLFNVLPTAASVGVGFQDVSAALASITLQGTPTSVATTQLRAALVEAAKGGTALDTALKDLTGKSFPQLVAGGMDIGTIFNNLRAAMPDQEFKDLFGSVEGLNAILSITGPNAAVFQSNLDAMKNSAGATDLAYQTMNQTLGASGEKLKAFAAVFLIDIGEKLAPVVALFTNSLISLLNSQGVTNFINGMGLAIQNMVGWIITASTTGIPTLTAAWNTLLIAFAIIQPIINSIDLALRNLILVGTDGGLAAIFTIVEDGTSSFTNFLTVLGLTDSVAIQVNAVIENMVNGTIARFQMMQTIVTTVFGAIVTAVNSNSDAIASKLNNAWSTVVNTVNSVFTSLNGIIMAVLGQVLTFVQTNGVDIAATFVQWTSQVISIVSTALQLLAGIILGIYAIILGFTQAHGAEIQTVLTGAWDIIKNVISGALTIIGGLLTAALQIFQGDWTGAWKTIQDMSVSVLGNIVGVITGALNIIAAFFGTSLAGIVTLWQNNWNMLVTITIKIVANIISIVQGLVNKAVSLGANFVQGIIDGVTGAASALYSTLSNLATSALNAAKSAIGAKSPSKRAADEIGLPIVQGIIQGVTNNAGQLATTMVTLAGNAVTGAQAVVNGIGAVLSETRLPILSTELGKTIIDNMTKAIQGQGLLSLPTVNLSTQTIVDNMGKTLTDSGLIGKAKNLGSNALKGLVSGMESQVSAAVNAAKNAAQKVVDGMAAQLEIKSPSEVFAREIGTPIVMGLMQGLIQTWPLITKWLKGNMAKTIAEFLTSSATLVRGAYNIFKSLKDLQTAPPFQPLIDATDALKTAQDSALGVSNKLLDLNAEIAALTSTPLSEISDHVAYNERLTALYAKQALLLNEQANAQTHLAQLGQTQAQAQAASVAQQQMINQIADKARQQYEMAQQQALTMMQTDAKAALTFFNERKAQIEEMAQLEKERVLATTDQERQSLDTQIRLLQAAQSAESTASNVTAMIQINPSGQSDQKIIDIIARALKDAGINVDIRTRTA
jgi:TP901 family phage tail tape measure protein